MSRSFKEPWFTDNGPHRIHAKRLANKKVRHYVKHLLQGTSYRHIFCSYDICDFKFFCPDNVKAYRK